MDQTVKRHRSRSRNSLAMRMLHTNPTKEIENNVPPVVTVYQFSADKFTSFTLDSTADAPPLIADGTVTWINMDGLRKDDVESLCTKFNVHPLLQEDILSLGQRPKMDEIYGVLFCVLNMLYLSSDADTVDTEQISMALGKNFVLTFQEDKRRDVFNDVREKLKMEGSRLRSANADYFFYTLLDTIVDSYFLIIEKFGDKIEQVEEKVISVADKTSLSQVNRLRNEIIIFKRNVSPVREMVNGILRVDSTIIEPKVSKYFKDIYDHMVQLNDLTDNYRDMAMSLQDLYLNYVNLRMNNVMKLLAIVTCLMAPSSVLSGIFGMNFANEPLLHTPYGFALAIGLMILIPVLMIIWFWKSGWFEG